MKNKWLLYIPLVGIIYVFIIGCREGFLKELPIKWYTTVISSAIQAFFVVILLLLLIII